MKTSMTAIRDGKRARRHRRIRVKVIGTPVRPRISVFRSNTGMYVQLIDDSSGKTIAAMSSNTAEGKTALEKARAVGLSIAKQAIAKKITAAVFDRSGYVYAGKVKAVAEGAREGGLIF